MTGYQNVLVIIKNSIAEQAILQRAFEICAKRGGRVCVLVAWCDETPPHSAQSADISQQVRRQEAAIQHQIKPWLTENIRCEIEFFTGGCDYKMIIHHVIKYRFQLVIKPIYEKKSRFALCKWIDTKQLLRQCPCPVWLVKCLSVSLPLKALVAVNLVSRHPQHSALNRQIIDTAHQLQTDNVVARLQLLAVYSLPFVTMSTALPAYLVEQQYPWVIKTYCHDMQLLRGKIHLNASQTLIVAGSPCEVIAEQVQQLRVNLIVIGNRGQDGWSLFRSRKTAEKLLNKLDCDLLVCRYDDQSK